MSKTEKAIESLNTAKLILCNQQMLTPEMCIKIGQAITDTITLLKEQEPAKPREERHEVKVSHDWGDEVEVWSKFYCPHCGAIIANSNSMHFPRCMWCGQAVKWNE